MSEEQTKQTSPGHGRKRSASEFSENGAGIEGARCGPDVGDCAHSADDAADDAATRHDSHNNNSSSNHNKRKRQRLRLSCLECRRRKLSCDRNFPCDRCVRSGTADSCTYDVAAGTLPNASAGVPLGFARLDSRIGTDRDGNLLSPDQERMRKLEEVVDKLKAALAKRGSVGEEGGALSAQHTPDGAPAGSPGTVVGHNGTVGHGYGTHPPDGKMVLQAKGPTLVDQDGLAACPPPRDMSKEELRFLRGKEFRTRYYGPYNASMAFSELLGLLPSVRDNPDEWLRPIFVCDRKDRRNDSAKREEEYKRRDTHLESLLPSQTEVDGLVKIYLDQFEQLHRIVHIPTFRRAYAAFWDPRDVTGAGRPAAFTALLLSILAVSSCVYGEDPTASPYATDGHGFPDTPPQPKYVGTVSRERHSAEMWNQAAEAWYTAQSMKHRRLIHYQIACLLYLGKRVNTIKKKRFWTCAGALTRDGIAVGLHRDPGPMTGRISIYNQEMRRRIWATVQEFDLQTGFDYGLPTLLTSLHFDAEAPRNLDDDEFDEDTVELPPSRSPLEYTFSSFQHVARQSLSLRLDLSRILYGQPTKLTYEQVVRYTNDLSRQIDSLPSWETNAENTAGAKTPLIAYTMLHIQLRQYLIPLHQPFIKLRNEHPMYQYSQLIYHNAARDIVQLHDKLYQMGIRVLNFMREDCLTNAIYLCSVTMMQPQGSTNMIMINSPHTLKLLEKCLSMKEDRLLRSGNNEPWGYCIMCNTVGLLDVHLGNKTAEEAKQWAFNRYIKLHQKLFPDAPPQRPDAPTVPLRQPLQQYQPLQPQSKPTNLMAHGPPWPRPPPALAPVPMVASPPAMAMTPWMSVTLGGQELLEQHTVPIAPNQSMDTLIAYSGMDPDQVWDDNWFLG